MKRLFFALYPDAETRRRCAAVLERIPQDMGNAVAIPNLHVTLLFLGSVDAGTERGLRVAATQVTVPTLAIEFNRLSFWPKPRVLCLTASRVVPELSALVGQLSALAKAAGIDVDKRSYRPHVTLMRHVSHSASLAVEPVLWQAGSFCLMESKPSPTGVVYEVIEQWTDPKA